jgi:Ni/Co efflux regulator RcnB
MKLLIIAAAVAAVAIAPAAVAKPGEGRGHGAKSAKALNPASLRQADNWNATNGVWTNPAGRAHPHGMPPGQAKKLAVQNGGLGVGAILSPSYPGYQPIAKYNAYNLPVAPAGTEYVRVGNNVYLRETKSGVISRVLGDLLQ